MRSAQKLVKTCKHTRISFGKRSAMRPYIIVEDPKATNYEEQCEGIDDDEHCESIADEDECEPAPIGCPHFGNASSDEEDPEHEGPGEDFGSENSGSEPDSVSEVDEPRSALQLKGDQSRARRRANRCQARAAEILRRAQAKASNACRGEIVDISSD